MPRPFTLVSVGIALVLAFFALFPLTRVLLRLFVSDGRIDLSPVRDAWTAPGLGRVLFDTLTIVVISSICALSLGSLLAWINERTDARMGFVTDTMPLLPFMIPSVASAVGWVLLFSPRAGLANAFIRFLLSKVGIEMKEGPFNIYTMYGMIFAYTMFMVPYVFLLISAGLRNMDPAMEEQSRICGAGKARTFLRVTFGALAPSVAGAVLLMVWFGLALYSIPVIIGSSARIEVLSVRIVNLMNFTYPPQTDMAVGLSGFIVVAVGLAWYFQGRVVRKGHHAVRGGKGTRGAAVVLGRWKWPVRAMMLAYMIGSSVLPAVGLALVALNGFWTPKIKWGELSLDTFRTVMFDDRSSQRSLINSVLLGVTGATIGVIAAAIIALFVQHSGRRLARVIDASIRLPVAFSAIVLGVGMILAFAGPPFRLGGTLWILLIAYLVIYMPQAMVAAHAAAGQVGKELPEASNVSGAGGLRTFRKVQLPIMAPGLAAGWCLLFVFMSGDLTASALLGGTANPVVGYKVLEVTSNGSYALLAALALVITIVSAIGVFTVLLITKRRTRWDRDTGTGRVPLT